MHIRLRILAEAARGLLPVTLTLVGRMDSLVLDALRLIAEGLSA